MSFKSYCIRSIFRTSAILKILELKYALYAYNSIGNLIFNLLRLKFLKFDLAAYAKIQKLRSVNVRQDDEHKHAVKSTIVSRPWLKQQLNGKGQLIINTDKRYRETVSSPFLFLIAWFQLHKLLFQIEQRKSVFHQCQQLHPDQQTQSQARRPLSHANTRKIYISMRSRKVFIIKQNFRNSQFLRHTLTTP